MKKKPFPLWAILLCGFTAGIMNGLLGAGGGIILIFVLRSVLGTETDGRDVYATALAVTLPITLLSALRYHAAGQLSLPSFLPLALPAIIGGIVGAVLLDRINAGITKRIFAAIVIFSGLNMLFR
ncbi:MAG: sulfite exporter TauE/SafE family protein [Clostridia bacterium]|nr:sulfite exporter TauE/SafE family protein [Clostridia bacterium]